MNHRAPLMILVLFVAYGYAITPQLDTLALYPHLLAPLYLMIFERWHERWSVWQVRFIKLFATVACGYLTWLHYGLLNGIDPGTSLLSTAAILKFSELRKFRDYLIILLICLFILNTNFVYNSSYFITLYVIFGNLAVFYWLTVCSSQVDLNGLSNRRRRIASTQRFKEFCSSVFHSWTLLSRTGQFASARRLSLWLTLTSLPVATLIFFAYPRTQFNLLNFSKSTSRALTGFSPYMEPGRFSELVNDNRLAFSVKFDEAPPPPEQLYWRALTLENYTSGRWSASDILRPLELSPTPSSSLSPGGEEGSSSLHSDGGQGYYHYSVILPDHRSRWLFSLDRPIAVSDAAQSIFLDHNGQLSLTVSPEQKISYDVESDTNLNYALDPGHRWESRKNLRISSEEAPRARRLASSWSGTPQEKVQQAIQWFVDNDFVYSLTTADLKQNTIDRFLFEEKRGFCELFSSSFAFLMRSAGVPARVVIGYQGGLYSEAGSTIRVYQYSAHAWTEVLLPSLERDGRQLWYRIDPTVIAQPLRLTSDLQSIFGLGEAGAEANFGFNNLDWYRWLDDTLFELSFIWDRWILSYSDAQQQELLDLLKRNGSLWLYGFLIGVGVLGLTVLLFRLSQRHLARSDDLLLEVYQRFCLRLKRRYKSLEIQPHEGCRTVTRNTIATINALNQKPGAELGTLLARNQRRIAVIRRFGDLWQRTRYRHDFRDRYRKANSTEIRALKDLLTRL